MSHPAGGWRGWVNWFPSFIAQPYNSHLSCSISTYFHEFEDFSIEFQHYIQYFVQWHYNVCFSQWEIFMWKGYRISFTGFGMLFPSLMNMETANLLYYFSCICWGVDELKILFWDGVVLGVMDTTLFRTCATLMASKHTFFFFFFFFFF